MQKFAPRCENKDRAAHEKRVCERGYFGEEAPVFWSGEQAKRGNNPRSDKSNLEITLALFYNYTILHNILSTICDKMEGVKR